MRYHSKHLYNLKELFSVPAEKYGFDESLYDFEKHKRAKVLAILLANARMATPRLNRHTIKGLLNGKTKWLKTDGTRQSINTPLDIELFEQLGLLSFYTDWCNTHFHSWNNQSSLDDSVKPLLSTLETIFNIKNGYDGFVKPHYIIDQTFAQTLTQDIVNTSYLEQLDELKLTTNGKFEIVIYEHHFSTLFATSLWQELTKKLSVKSAFKQWILTNRVYHNWITMPNLEHLSYEQQTAFQNECVHLILNDDQLNRPWSVLINQWQFEQSGTQMLIESCTTIEMTLSAKSGQVTTHTSDNSNVTHSKGISLDELINDNTQINEPHGSALDIAIWWQMQRLYKGELPFYRAMVADLARQDIRVDRLNTASSEIIEKLIGATDNKPELQHILFNSMTLLPQNTDYLLFLLTKRRCSALAIYLIKTNAPTLFHHSMVNNTAISLHHIYWPMLCDDFLGVTFNRAENENFNDFISLIMQLLKNCDFENLHKNDSNEVEKLNTLLEKLTIRQLAQIADQLLESVINEKAERGGSFPYWKFFILFWLLEKQQMDGIFTKNVNLDISKDTDWGLKLQNAIATLYSSQFKSKFDTKQHELHPCYFFDTLPWHRLNAPSAIDTVLSLIPNPALCISQLDYKQNKNSFGNQKLIGCFLQLLLCLYDPDKQANCTPKILNKILDTISGLGFLPNTNHLSLFGNNDVSDKYNLWVRFTDYVDTLDDNGFSRVMDVVKQKIPINRLLELYKKTSRNNRKTQLLALIQNSEFSDKDNEGLDTLKEALELACETGQIVLAKALLATAKQQIADSPWCNSRYFAQHEIDWKVYEYKLSLVSHYSQHNGSTAEKINSAADITNPFTPADKSHYLRKGGYWECERFKRYIEALELYSDKPLATYNYLNQLCIETANKNKAYVRNRFAAKLKYLEIQTCDITAYQQALTEYLKAEGQFDIISFEPVHLANLMECNLKLTKHDEITTLWNQSRAVQQHDIAVATVYCRSLKENKEHYKAQRVFEQLKEYHQQNTLDENADKLLTELNEFIVSDQPIAAQIAITQSLLNQRNTIEALTRYFEEISCKPLEEQIEIITGKKTSLESFLCEHIQQIIGELLLRTQNLRIHHKDRCTTKISTRITKEDLINDWFVSLFELHFSHMELSCRDQKRGGHSGSKKDVENKGIGEIDSFITKGDNQRIAILEAFRLFSNDNTVITSHLYKLAGYDLQTLSPVIILAYCDVSDFAALADNYRAELPLRQYFEKVDPSTHQVEVVEDKEHSIIYKEVRHRGNAPVSIYHFLMDFRMNQITDNAGST